MADTVYDIDDSLRRQFKDPTPTSGDPFFSDAELLGFIMRRATGSSQAYSLAKLTTNYYATPGLRLSLLAASYSAEGGCTYSVYCCGERNGGPIVKVTAGTATANPFSLSGIPVDYPRVVADIARFIATQRCDEYTMSIGGSSLSPQTVYDQMMKLARYWDGAQGI